MRDKNRRLVKTMIISCSIGAIVLMVMMFVGIKLITKDNLTSVQQDKETIEEVVKPDVEYSATLLACIKEISPKRIVAFDVEKKQVFDKTLDIGVQVTDSAGELIPITSMNPGDIVEVLYQPEQDKILKINTTKKAWKQKDVTGIILNKEENTIVVKNQKYKYTNDTIVLTEDRKPATIESINKHDVVTIVGIENELWSVQINQKAGRLILAKMPTNKGMLEIDYNTMIPLSEIGEGISLLPGVHKVVVKMEGYEPIVEKIKIESDKPYTLSLQGGVKKYTDLFISVTNTDVTPTVLINGVPYSIDEPIHLLQGQYKIKVEASGYSTWQANVLLDAPTKELTIALIPIQNKEQTDTQTNQGNTTGHTENGQASKDTITLSTDPQGASVYIGEVYKGKTPLTTNLPKGSYAVSFKKDGFETYWTSLILDENNTQNNFLYVLEPKAQ